MDTPARLIPQLGLREDMLLDVTQGMCAGMTGSISVKGQESARYVMSKEADPDQWPPRFWKVQLNFSKGVHMAFCDPRRQVQGSEYMVEGVTP